jgi:glucose/arabinose dehydrogenase
MKQTIIYSGLCIALLVMCCYKKNDNNNDTTAAVLRPAVRYNGRMRDVCISPGGKVYVCTDNGSNDKIIEA